MESVLYRWRGDSHSNKEELFFRALSQLYISMAVIDLNAESSVVLSSKTDAEIIGIEMPWASLLERFVSRRVFREDQNRLFSFLSAQSLSMLWDSDVSEKNIEVRCWQKTPDDFEWVEVSATVFDRDTRQILVTTRNITETKLQKRVLDQFLYHQNCDFFILVNLTENNYKIFDVCSGLLPIPEMGCSDYMADMIRFNSQFVVKNEAARVITMMSLDTIPKLLADRDEHSFTVGINTESGEYRRARIQLIAFDRAKHLVIITRSDITSIYLEEKRRNEQLLLALRAAQLDMLTGLYNQATTEEIVSQMLAGYPGGLAAVLFIDVDNFKMVNDTLGHLQGNELLKRLAGILMSFIGKNAVVGRVGGDEFLLFMPEVPSMQEIYETGSRICGAFDTLRDITGELPVSCSVGVSLYPQDGTEYETLVQKADQALYRSKRYGKNKYSLYSEELEPHQYYSSLSKID